MTSGQRRAVRRNAAVGAIAFAIIVGILHHVLSPPAALPFGGDYHRQAEAEAAYICDPAGFYPEGRPVWQAEDYCGNATGGEGD